LLSESVQVLSIDLADLTDEEAHHLFWTIGRTQPGFPTEAREFAYRTDFQKELLDGGRLISGKLSFPIAASANEKLVLVARLHPQEAGAMAVKVNDRHVGPWRYPAAKGHWLETAFAIPGDLITDVPLKIELQHIDEGGTTEPTGIYHLWAYQGLSLPPEAAPQMSLEKRFESGIVLQGYDLAANELRPGDDLRLTLYWSAENTPDVDAKVFLHLYDAQGEIVAQIDQRPFDDTRPPYTWLPGEQIVDLYQLPLPADLRPGTYELAIGLYDPVSGERLNVITTGSEKLPDNRIFLEQILIQEK